MGQFAHLYNTKRWRQLRARQLATEPLCRLCKQTGRVTAANIADHMQRHRGDEHAFFNGPLQSLCKACHDGAKQRQEHGRGLVGCDADGMPLDPEHHWQDQRGGGIEKSEPIGGKTARPPRFS